MTSARALSLVVPLALCGAGSGCLYAGGYNEAPELSAVTLHKAPDQCGQSGELAAASRFAKQSVTLCAAATDDQRLNYDWRVTLTDIDGVKWAYDKPDAPVQALSSFPDGPPTWSTVYGYTSFELARLGHYTVEVTATDPDGAATTYTREFDVGNHAPLVIARFVPQNVDSTLGDDAYPAHADYWVVLDDSDDDEELLCGEAKVEFDADAATKALFERWEVMPCNVAGTRLDVLALRGDPSKFSAPKTIALRAKIIDKRGGGANDKPTELYVDADTKRRLTLHPNRPPCLVSTDYSAASRQLLVASSGSGAAAQDERSLDAGASGLDDIVGATTYHWGVSRTLAGPYDTIAGEEQTLTVTPDYAPPGQVRFFRVHIEDGLSAPPSAAECPDAAWGCQQSKASGRLSDSCYRWLTWKVEFR